MNHTLTGTSSDGRSLLRGVLMINAGTSLLAGLTAVVARKPVVELFGLDGGRAELVVLVVGIGLVVFAAEVAFTGLRSAGDALSRNVALISAADVALVVATVVVLASVELSTTGRVVAAVMGLGVAAFAALQIRLR